MKHGGEPTHDAGGITHEGSTSDSRSMVQYSADDAGSVGTSEGTHESIGPTNAMVTAEATWSALQAKSVDAAWLMWEPLARNIDGRVSLRYAATPARNGA